MKYLIIFLMLFCAHANIYDTLNDFAYNKKNSSNIQTRDVLMIELKRDNKACIDMILNKNKIYILKKYDICDDVDDFTLYKYLNQDFINLYFKDLTFIKQELIDIKNIMREIMLYYTLHHSFPNSVRDMSKNKKIDALNLNSNSGGQIIYKVNNQACVVFDLFVDENSQENFYIMGIENLDKQCLELISSPEFKELSFTKKEMKKYRLKN
ncbi:hypothetical protein [Campylobacter insulaenigrae]|uniref:hypothetical protein n=1 Tax=Campylobacter insulaenigrae TaxID=260714 RepID=UPI00243106BD|nr:hypothetical protein [Campylobacter insulaenigrae]